jgi:hypothetical protein
MKNIAALFLLLNLFSVSTSSAVLPSALVNVNRCAIFTFEIEFERSEAVFVGTVSSLEKEGDAKIFEFRVDKFWKGVSGRLVKVAVYENPKFQAQFRVGGRFLVFAKVDDDGVLFDGRCSRSRDLDRVPEAAEDDLAKLGPGKVCEGEGPDCG